MNITKGIHLLEFSTDIPPENSRNEIFVDGFGNKFKLVFHQTPTAGIAVTAGGPVGFLDGTDNEIVTADISQSAARKVAGVSMVSLTIAETATGQWHWIMIKGNLKEYAAGGAAVPIGDTSPAAGSFLYTSTYVPVGDLPFASGGVADENDVIWSGDDEWDGSIGVATEVAAGRALATDATVDVPNHLVEWDLR